MLWSFADKARMFSDSSHAKATVINKFGGGTVEASMLLPPHATLSARTSVIHS